MALKILFNNKSLDNIVSKEIKSEKFSDLSREKIDGKVTQIFQKYFEGTAKAFLFDASIISAIKSSVKKQVRAEKTNATRDFIKANRFLKTNTPASEQNDVNNIITITKNIKEKIKTINEAKYIDKPETTDENGIVTNRKTALTNDLKALVNLIRSIDGDLANKIDIKLNQLRGTLNPIFTAFGKDNKAHADRMIIENVIEEFKRLEGTYLSNSFITILTENEMGHILDNESKITKILDNNNFIDRHKVHKKFIKETGIGTVEDNLYLSTYRNEYGKLRCFGDQERERYITDYKKKSNDDKALEPNSMIDKFTNDASIQYGHLDKILIADLEKRFSEEITPFLNEITRDAEGREIFHGHFIHSTLKSILEEKQLLLDNSKLSLYHIKNSLDSDRTYEIGGKTVSNIEWLIGKTLTKAEKEILSKCFTEIFDAKLIKDIHLYLKINGKSSNPLINLIGKNFFNENTTPKKEKMRRSKRINQEKNKKNQISITQEPSEGKVNPENSIKINVRHPSLTPPSLTPLI